MYDSYNDLFTIIFSGADHVDMGVYQAMRMEITHTEIMSKGHDERII